MYPSEFYTPPTPEQLDVLSILKQRFVFNKAGGDTTVWANSPANKPSLIGKRAGFVQNNSKRQGRKISAGPKCWMLSFVHNGKTYTIKEHHAVFLVHYGWLPPMIDHFDDNCLNNALSNLVPTNNQTNASRRRTSERPGLARGVYPTRGGKFTVALRDPSIGRQNNTKSNKMRYFGTFATLEEANSVARTTLINMRPPNGRPITHLVP